MTDEAIRTVVDGGRAEFHRKGSRFIGYLTHCSSRGDADEIVQSIAHDHQDATHVVWAYRLDDDPISERADDDGEPGGSAGSPALRILQGDGLLDVLAVVVRYYGGTNLGYGGLVRAYSQAVKDAIDAAVIDEQVPTTTVVIDVGYDDSGTVQSILESEEVDFDARYEEAVSFRSEMPKGTQSAIIDRILSATGGRAEVDH